MWRDNRTTLYPVLPFPNHSFRKDCGERGIRTPGTLIRVRQFSKLLVSATHPSLQFHSTLTVTCELGLQNYIFSLTYQIFFHEKWKLNSISQNISRLKSHVIPFKSRNKSYIKQFIPWLLFLQQSKYSIHKADTSEERPKSM